MEDRKVVVMEELRYSPLESVFKLTMQREGKELETYTSGEKFQAFFRKNEDNNNIQDTIKLYYSVDAPVREGKIVKFGRKKYLLLNQETEENTCYYKSAAIALNGEIILNDGSLSAIPCYAYDINNGLAQTGQTISVLSGNMDFLTEDNEQSRKIRINDEFNEFGRTWHTDNIYYKDGIAHIITKITEDKKYQEKLTMSIIGIENSYTIDDTVKLQVILSVNGSETEGTVQWTVSDPEVASIDDAGNAIFLKAGTVKFTAKWVEKDMEQESSTITVVEQETLKPTITATISGRNLIRPGVSYSYTVKFTDKSGNEINNVDFQWKVIPSFESNDRSYTISDKSIKLTLDNWDLGGETITLQVIQDGIILAEKEITVT